MQITDDLGRMIDFCSPSKRIISLVPSLTELLFDLGLDNEVVGITRFCCHPQLGVKGKSKVGGTKKVDLAQIVALAPDLIIANKEENDKDDLESLSKRYPVYISDIADMNGACRSIQNIGRLTGTVAKAMAMTAQIRQGFQSVKNLYDGSVLYMIWQKPWMAAGKQTYIDWVLTHLGFENELVDQSRYPELDEGGFEKLSPDFVFLSSEPFPFKEKQRAEFQLIFPNAKILLVDGEMFSWYGSRMLLAIEYFKNLKEEIY